MSNPNPKRKWKPGQSGNPKGTSKKQAAVNAIVKRIREIEKHELTESFSELYKMTRNQLKKIIDDPKTSMKEVIIASAIFEAAKSGQFAYIQPYIAYIFGMPTQKMEHTGKNGEPIKLSDSRQRLLDRVLKKISQG
jgi:hypothetical protein